MITFVCKRPDRDAYFKAHHPDWNYQCGGDETTDDITQAAVFQAELKGNTLVWVGRTDIPDGDWEAVYVKVSPA
jgi:hypothetical protein